MDYKWYNPYVIPLITHSNMDSFHFDPPAIISFYLVGSFLFVHHLQWIPASTYQAMSPRQPSASAISARSAGKNAGDWKETNGEFPG